MAKPRDSNGRDPRPRLAGRSLVTHDPAGFREKVREETAAGRHRDLIGYRWETLGSLLMEYLIEQELKPFHRFLDIGCGPLRIGVHLVEYLDAGNYYGIDEFPELLAAGYDVELTALGLTDKLPRDHLVATGEFDFQLLPDSASIDAALAQSVFTHLPIAYLRLCLIRLTPILRPGGIFHATFFLVPDVGSWALPATHPPDGITSYPIGDPYHHTWADLVHAADELPWSVDGPIDISHPAGQSMVRFHRLTD